MRDPKRPAMAKTESRLPEPLLHLLRSFADIVGLGMHWCKIDGSPAAAFAARPAAGPCAFFSKEANFSEACARSHAGAIENAHSLRRPYIFTCHAQLAAWAIPILTEETPFPFTIICGGALLAEPDAALANHLGEVADLHLIDPSLLAGSLGELPVVSREYFRTAAAFIFDLAHAFLMRPADIHARVPAPPPAFSFIEQPQLPLVFPPRHRKEAKKEKEQRAIEQQQRNAEEEIVRLLRERRQEEALRALLRLLKKQNDAAAGSPRADAAEIFTRLFRVLPANRRPEQYLQEQQAALLKQAFGLTRGPEGKKNLARLCEQFLEIAHELVGPPRPRQLKAIQKYLEKNLSKKLTLGTVGTKFALREKPLNEMILRNCGMSFTDYVISLRIAQAKRLLETTDLNLGQVALKTGFSDQSYFTKVFKAAAGMTPSEYLNTHRRI